MITTIVFKELKVFFRTPSAYFIAGLFTLILGQIFFSQMTHFVQNIQTLPVDMRNQYDFSNEVIIKIFGNANFLLLFVIPILGAKIFSQEFHRKTIDLFTLSAVSSLELIIAKFLSLWIQGVFLISTSLIFPFFLGNLNTSDSFFILTGYAGLLLNLFCYCTLTCFASSLTSNQIMSALLGFVLIFFTWMMSMFTQMSSNYFAVKILEFLSINTHFENFVQANVSFVDISYYFSFISFGIIAIKKRFDLKR